MCLKRKLQSPVLIRLDQIEDMRIDHLMNFVVLIKKSNDRGNFFIETPISASYRSYLQKGLLHLGHGLVMVNE